MKPLLLCNLRQRARLLVALFLGIAGFEVVLLHIGASFERQGGLQAIFEFLPPLMKKLLEPQLKMASFEGLIAFGFQHPGVLITCVGYVLTLASLPAIDREEGTLELFLARPLHRRTYLAAQLATLTFVILLLATAVFTGVAIGLSTVDVEVAPPLMRYFPCALNLVALLFAFGALSFLFAVASERRATGLAWAVGITLVLFVIDTLAPLATWLEPLRYASPFYYFLPINAGVEGVFPTVDILVLAVVSAVFVALAVRRFQARDL